MVDGEGDEVPKPKFVFGQNLSGINNNNGAKKFSEEAKKIEVNDKPFSFNFKFTSETPFEKKVPFGQGF